MTISFWVIIAIVWGIVAAAVCMILPVIEASDVIASLLDGSRFKDHDHDQFAHGSHALYQGYHGHHGAAAGGVSTPRGGNGVGVGGGGSPGGDAAAAGVTRAKSMGKQAHLELPPLPVSTPLPAPRP